MLLQQSAKLGALRLQRSFRVVHLAMMLDRLTLHKMERFYRGVGTGVEGVALTCC